MGIAQWLSVDLKERMKQGKPLQIVDVRQPEEYASGHIPGAKLIPLNELPARYREIDPNIASVFVCRSGNRSAMACEFLQNIGYRKIYNLMGGMQLWDGEVET